MDLKYVSSNQKKKEKKRNMIYLFSRDADTDCVFYFLTWDL